MPATWPKRATAKQKRPSSAFARAARRGSAKPRCAWPAASAGIPKSKPASHANAVLKHEAKPWRWALVFLFGLVHGLGFAGSFSALAMQPGDFARPLILLNVGIELGQLSVVAACAALTWWAWNKSWYNRVVVYPASIAIALLASWWTIQRGFGLG